MQLNDLQNGFKLGNYLIEPLRGLITGAHKQKHLQPKSMDVLVFLASHANQVVSRQQLLDAVWGPRYVSDEPLTRCIADLRAAFSDNPKQPKFIETIPKRGYHLIAEVQLSGDENETVRSQVLKRKQRFSNVLFATIVIIAVGSIYLLQQYYYSSDIQGDKLSPSIFSDNGNISIVVLPFLNLGDDPDNEYFSDGLAEELIQFLSSIPSFHVISRTSAFSYKDSNLPLTAIANQLHVNHVIEGSVRKYGNRVRITVQLIEAETDFYLWSETFERELTDIFTIQKEISLNIVQVLKEKFNLDNIQQELSLDSGTTNIDAYLLYLKALYLVHQPNSVNVLLAEPLLLQAIETDPSLAEAYAELALLYVNMPDFTAYETSETFPKAKDYVAKALDMDPELVKPHLVLARLLYAEGNWIEAENGYVRILDMDPNNYEGISLYAQLLARVGKIKTALPYFLKLYRLDPVRWIPKDWLAYIYMALRDPEQMELYANDSVKLGNTASLGILSRWYISQGEIDKAEELLIRRMKGYELVENAAQIVAPYFDGLRNPAKRDAAIESVPIIASYFGLPERRMFKSYIDIGAIEKAVNLLSGPLQPVDFYVANQFWTPMAEEFRKHPKFPGILDRMGLIEYWKEHGWGEYCREDGNSVVCH